MNDKDKEEFIAWYKNKESEFDNCKEAWQAACEYKDKEINDDEELLRYHMNSIGYRELKKLQAENKKLREALEFYAKETNWKLNKNNHAPLFSKCENDLGDIAREALKEVGEK